MIASKLNHTLVLMLIGVLLGAVTSQSHANRVISGTIPYANTATWDNIVSEDGTDCRVCHTYSRNIRGKNNYNGFGWDIRNKMRQGLSFAEAIVAVEHMDSDANGIRNIYEITAGGQPGWKELDNYGYSTTGVYIYVQEFVPRQAPLDPVFDAAKISIDPWLDFGVVPTGSSGIKEILVSNIGGADLNVSVDIIGAEFSLYDSSLSTFTVAPHSAGYLALRFTPAVDGGSTSELVLTSDDPYEPTVTVSLTGNGAAGPASCAIVLGDESLDFGTVNKESTKTKTTTIHNNSTAPCEINLSVTNVDLDSAFTLNANAPTSAVIAGGDSLSVDVDYTPPTASSDLGELVIEIVDQPPLISVPLSGTGIGLGVDLDIIGLQLPDRVRVDRNIRPKITIDNVSGGSATRTAELVGVQNGVTVYSEQISISTVTGTADTFSFPWYAPSLTGTIDWTATVDDDDPDLDQFNDTTLVY